MNFELVLGIETSCDETAASVVLEGTKVLSNIISSQIDTHRVYGGVVPEIASRKHIESISFVVGEAFRQAGIEKEDVGAIAATCGPGLAGALIVGLSYAKALSFGLKKPMIGVNHIEGHIAANYIEDPTLKPPFLCLVASGGHTHLLMAKSMTEYEVLGRTRDDAAGEAYDKTARALGLPYPGGPAIDALAPAGNPDAVPLPKAEVSGAPWDFSFSGLKSATLNYINRCRMTSVPLVVADVAASFQKAVTEVLTEKAVGACVKLGADKLALAGGVASNTALRALMKKACEKRNIKLYMPRPLYCTDNAAMIASCGYFQLQQGKISTLDLNANPDLAI
ncbi:MAG: tRNA (adenosine(37)-N6)-threonylcarbamoyltransferase complex transferase subunit TsaD [Clostridiales bacterium]|jgi:N6-L-threonylcarbamoyladenine synthase|nr:tRNA (adenosine(37)-N6)-threonylcarbamoyltransferase complex transferase subunit TsaD [Clostridiales bacterium]